MSDFIGSWYIVKLRLDMGKVFNLFHRRLFHRLICPHLETTLYRLWKEGD